MSENHTHTHTTSVDDDDRFRLDADGFAITHSTCHECGEVTTTIAQAYPDFRLYTLHLVDVEGNPEVEEYVVAERDYTEESLLAHINKLQGALVQLRTHKRLVSIAHSHRG